MVREIYVKRVLNSHGKRDRWFLDEYSVNPYKLCQLNCVYCYIRGSRYGGNMGRELSVKVNAPTILMRELQRKARRGEYGFIAISSSTEPWQPIEKTYQVTRRCLEVISRYRFPVHCLTKSSLILRDLDLLQHIDENAILPVDLKARVGRGVLITFSLSTLDEEVAKVFEPGAPKPRERLEALRRVREEGFLAGVAYIPVLPFISDGDEALDEMVRAAVEFDASYLFIGSLTLFGVGRELYYNVLRRHFPELLPRYQRLFGASHQPGWAYQNELEQKARMLCRKHGVKYKIV